jgi:thiol-disulfide isomerase/thioredoxin
MAFALRHGLLALALLLSASGALAAEPPKAGDLAPTLVGVSQDNEHVDLAAFRGKAVVVSFWATWCPYCMKELPVLDNIQRKVGKDRIQVIAVNTESRDVFRKASRMMAPVMAIELAYDRDEVAQGAYGVRNLPYMVIIRSDGTIDSIHKGYGEESLPEIVSAINRVIATPAPTSAKE